MKDESRAVKRRIKDVLVRNPKKDLERVQPRVTHTKTPFQRILKETQLDGLVRLVLLDLLVGRRPGRHLRPRPDLNPQHHSHSGSLTSVFARAWSKYGVYACGRFMLYL